MSKISVNKKNREFSIPKGVKRNKESGFVCYFCDRKENFHSEVDARRHYDVCQHGAVVLQKNLNSGFVYQHTTNLYVCIFCGDAKTSLNGIKYHVRSHKNTHSSEQAESESGVRMRQLESQLESKSDECDRLFGLNEELSAQIKLMEIHHGKLLKELESGTQSNNNCLSLLPASSDNFISSMLGGMLPRDDHEMVAEEIPKVVPTADIAELETAAHNQTIDEIIEQISHVRQPKAVARKVVKNSKSSSNTFDDSELDYNPKKRPKLMFSNEYSMIGNSFAFTQDNLKYAPMPSTGLLFISYIQLSPAH